MSKLQYSKAFAKYGAKLANPQWAVSAIAEDGALVMSCWTHYMKREGDVLRYRDRLSRWAGNELGNALLRKHLGEAFASDLPVRYLSARTDSPETVDNGHDASTVKKQFAVRPDLIGRVVEFDGDAFVIDFRRV